MAELVQIPIIWSDEYLLVIDKPAGLLAVPDGYDPSLPHVRSVLAQQFGPLWIVHRLDRYTSGVMLLARSADAHQKLNTQFQEREIKKTYSALVLGKPPWNRKLIDLPLRINTGRRHRTVVDLSNGKRCVTHFKVCERFWEYSLIEAEPETGRRHQIRAHLSGEGYPVACDSLYGDQKEIHRADIDPHRGAGSQPGEPVLKRPGLHARSIELVNPFNGKMCYFKSPHASDLEITLNILRS